MSLRVHYEILNQKGTPAFYSDVIANRPTYGFAGRVFISTDTGQIFEDTGSAWTLIADAGVGGGTLASVCANGNTTSTGIIISAGNLGINTSSPGAPLDVHGTGTNAQFNGTGTNNAYLQFQNAGTSKWRIGNTYNAGANSFDLYNNVAASTALSVNAASNVLQLNANLAIKQSTGFYNISGYGGIACDAGGFFFNATGGSNNAYLNLANLTNSRTFTFPDTNGTLALTSQIPAASQWTTSGSNIYFATGSVGIGTTNVVEGTQAAGSLSIIKSSSVGGGALIQFAGNGRIRPADTGDRFSIDGNAIYLNSTFAANIFMNTAGGNTIINSTADNGFPLQVNGAICAKGTVCGYQFQNRAASNFFTFYSNTDVFLYNSNTSNIASIGATTGVYTPLSDINRKKDFELSNIGLNAILNLKPTLYRMKEENNTEKHLGFIAQEVKEFIPQAFVESSDFIGLNYQAIVATLVKAIQELNEKLERNNIN
jgi:trimeric autotransporter adhesin